VIARLGRATGPAEARFFLFLGAFGLVLAAIYWAVSYELAGTILLGGFGLGAGLLGVRLRIERQPGDTEDPSPFRDDPGRLPGETLAPLALALGVALALTAVVFGVWLLVAGLVPIAWGAWTWLRGARDELNATVAGERRADER
jgi:Cytochrome c oxidase subunit IV